MSWHFDPKRATQAAGVLFTCSGGDRMAYLKLLKLLYFADRESIQQKGRPITGDEPWAMDYGPVLTRIYDYIKCNPRKGVDVWAKYFRTVDFDVVRAEDPGADALSRYDRRILAAVYEAHKDLDGFEVSQLSRDFPEWKDAYKGENTSTRIPEEAILVALGIGEEDRRKIAEQIASERDYFEGVEKLKNELEHQAGGLLSA